MPLTATMPAIAVPCVPRHLRRRREKLFGDGRPQPLDRNAKVRVMTLARTLMRRTEPGRHYGTISAKFCAVLEALLFGFHNAHTGRCFPSYDTIAERAGCARSTVYEAIRALEAAGVLTWVNRIARIREPVLDLFGQWATRWRVIRTSNAYAFIDPHPGADCRPPSKSESQTGTSVQDLNLSMPSTTRPPLDPDNPLHAALMRLGGALRDPQAA
jgi:Helix-turn-helix domain